MVAKSKTQASLMLWTHSKLLPFASPNAIIISKKNVMRGVGMRKKTTIIFAVITVICAVFVYAKVFTALDGTVKSKDGKPIAGARVILIFSQDGTKFELVTDEKGRWRKMNLQPGIWKIGIIADGYEPKNLNVELSSIKKNPPIDVRLNPLPKSPLIQGDALYAEKKYEEALKEYTRVLKEHPDLYQIYDKIGLCYYRLNDYDNAIENFIKMMEKEPGSQNTLINLSAIYLERGDLEEGMKYFRQLDEQTLADPSLFYNIGVLFFNSNQIEMAIHYLEKGIEIAPNYVEAHYQVGLAYLNKGDMEKAKESFEKVIEIDPDSEKAVSAKNLLMHIK
jgi:Tfp pilus assembly protein PilF